MSYKKIALILFVLVLFSSLVSAASYESFMVEANLQENNVIFTYDLNGNFENEDLVLELTPNAKNVEVYVDGEEVECEVEEKVGKTVATCNTLEGFHFVEMQYETNYPLIDFNQNLMFKYDQNFEAKEFVFILQLPTGYIIEDTRFITPEADYIFSDGKRIILSWQEEDFSGLFSISVITTKVIVDVYSKYLFYLVLILLILLISFSLNYSYKKWFKKFIKKEEKKELHDILLENEKKVVEVLKEAEDKKLWQKQLQIKTELSKVKLSRLLRSMEKRGVITKEPYGTSNIIRLKVEK